MKSFVPTPAFFEARAIGLWPHRWRFGIASVTLAAAMFALMLMQRYEWMNTPYGLAIGFLTIGTLAIFALWGCLCIGTWFHPEYGSMRMENRWWLFTPRFVRVFVRWYAAMFLAVWFLVWAGLVIFFIHAAFLWAIG